MDLYWHQPRNSRGGGGAGGGSGGIGRIYKMYVCVCAQTGLCVICIYIGTYHNTTVF